MLPRLPAALLLLAILAAGSAQAQTRILPLGDSITNGGQAHASYRYELWLDLAAFDVDFVGRETEIDGGDPPNLAWYPLYLSDFDPDHEGYWGFRTDEIADLVEDAAAAAQPDIVLAHLGTNDIGQQGAAGVTNADTNLRLIIQRLRAENPAVTVLLARVIPIGPGTGYFANAGEVANLNAVVDQIAVDLDTPQSRVLVVDLNTGFDLGTLMQPDGLHPNVAGEAWMADGWRAVLEPLLPPGNPPPDVELDQPADGATFTAPAAIALAATASDDGVVTRVTFRANGQDLGEDTTTPYALDWTDPPLGQHVLTAVAEDDGGKTATSQPVTIEVRPFGAPTPVPVANASFEVPALGDQATAPGPGVVGEWTFSASANTFVGIFDPPAGSYPEAAGSGTPIGADGENAAYLFNNGGPAEFVEATQTLGESLAPGSAYVLRVAIGQFLPDQPYVFSTYGGYRIELLAGTTVIASDSDTIVPPVGAFRDAVAAVATADLDPARFGEPLAIRLTLSGSEAPRSTHFDAVRLTRSDVTVPAAPALGRVALALALVLVAGARASRRAGA